MLSDENKISRGLSRLLSSDRAIRHFKTSPEIFIENPGVVSNYFDLFSDAQLNEFANH
ncbi:MAG: hypothetical protein GY816_20760 [Cytophagales bacterium]|nr:hypothetical protein [Cytophagales bacterium]